MVSCGHVTKPILFDKVIIRNLRPEMTQNKAIATVIQEYASIHIVYSIIIHYYNHSLHYEPLRLASSRDARRKVTQTLSGPHLVLLLFPAHLPLWVHGLLLHQLVIEAGQP